MKLAQSTLWTLLALLPFACATAAQDSGQQARERAATVERPTTTAYASLLRKAAALIKRGKPDAAYRLLEPLEFEHAGDSRFDYLIGIAALDSGKPDQATFALERALAVNPDFAAARLDLARAYYQLGDLTRARIEFSTVLKQKPSKAARASIRSYLDAIDAKKNAKRTRLTGYLAGTLGHDDNINYSTSEQQVFIDRFSTLAILDPSNVQTADNYYALATGATLSHDLGTSWGIYASVDALKRGYDTHGLFDALNLDIQAGITYHSAANHVRIGVTDGQQEVGGVPHSDTTGVKGEWRHTFSPSNQLHTFVQLLQYRLSDPVLQPNDFDQQAIGLGWQHVLPGGKSMLYGRVYYGAEKDVSPIITEASPTGGRNDGAKSFHGLRVGGQTTFGQQTTLFASAGIQDGDYDKVNFYFQRQRADRLYDMTLGAAWQWHKLWTLRPQFSYTRNESNIALYEYDRQDLSVTVRRDFR